MSNPTSDSYGAHLSLADLAWLVAPSEASFEAVTQWLLTAGGASSPHFSPRLHARRSDAVSSLNLPSPVAAAGVERRLDTLRVTCSASLAEQLLGAQMQYVTHVASGAAAGPRALGGVALAAPASVAAHVDFLAGLTEYFDPAETKIGGAASRARRASAAAAAAPPAAAAAPRTAAAGAPASPAAAAAVQADPWSGPAYIQAFLRQPGGGVRTVLSVAPGPPPTPPTHDDVAASAAAPGGEAPLFFAAKDVPMTPAGVRALYGIPEGWLATGRAVQGVAAFDDIFEPGSLCAAQGLTRSAAAPVAFIGSSDNVDKIESDLDVQYISALAPGAVTLFRNQPAGMWVLQFAEEAVNNLGGLTSPHAWSLSYGWPEQCVRALREPTRFFGCLLWFACVCCSHLTPPRRVSQVDVREPHAGAPLPSS